MKRHKVKNVQFWISEHEDYVEIHFEGTNQIKDIQQWPWPWYRFSHGVSTPVFGAYVATRDDIHKIMEPYISGNKRIKITCFSWGCTLAYLHADDAYVYRAHEKGNPDTVVCILDDPPRFLEKGYRDARFPLLVWYKGRSIVHHLPFAWMGYKKHIARNIREIPSKAKWWDIRALITDHYKLKIPR